MGLLGEIPGVETMNHMKNTGQKLLAKTFNPLRSTSKLEPLNYPVP